MTTQELSLARESTFDEHAIMEHNIYGHGSENVLVFHDWMGDASNYESIKTYLDAERYCYAFLDLRGYGKSRDLPCEFTVVEAVADASRLADHLG